MSAGTTRIVRRALVAGAALALAACRRDAASGSGSYDDRVAEAVPKVERSVGVPFKRPPKLELRSREQVRDFLVRQFDAGQSATQLAGEEAALKVLGFIPDTLHLRSYLIDLLTEQVIGYYDPATKVLYVNKDAPKDVAGITITHELVHALQDQYFDLDSLQKAAGTDDDRTLAAQSVIEGQATFEQMSIMTGGNMARLPGGWDRIRDLIRESSASQPRFSAAPMYVQETLLFPYINGADYVRRFREAHPKEQPWSHMPVSTEQVMHAGGPTAGDAPVRIAFAALPNTLYANDLGEFGTRLFLYQHLQDQNTAARAGMGWAGDRFAVVRTPQGNAIAWVTAWDTPLDAAEFVTAAQDAMVRRYKAKATGEGGAARTITGSGRTVQITSTELDGRNVVLFVDVPAGASPALLDLRRVTLDRPAP